MTYIMRSKIFIIIIEQNRILLKILWLQNIGQITYGHNGHFQLNPIPFPIRNMTKIICFVGSFSKLYSQSLFLHINPAYTVSICDSVV